MLITDRGDRPTIWWYASWIVPAIIGVSAIGTLEMWLPELTPDPLYADMEAEHASVCRRFGLDARSDQLSVCQRELRELRSRDESRMIFF